MNSQTRQWYLPLTALLMLLSSSALGSPKLTDAEELKVAALEALMSAPSEKALPIVTRVLNGNDSDEVKEHALFVLSQIDLPEAQQQLMTVAMNSDGDLQYEAVRMIGIGGDSETLAQLRDLYNQGDEDLREAVLEAYLIADEVETVYELAVNSKSEDEYDDAVEVLAAMDAIDELRRLRESRGVSEALIEALAISDDFESLKLMALDGSDTDLQMYAIEGLAIVDNDAVGDTLLQIYRESSNEDIREEALEGLLISDHDEGVLQLYRDSTDLSEKRQLLELLVMMDSDLAMQVIDDALGAE